MRRIFSILFLIIATGVVIGLGFMYREGKLRIGQAGCVGSDCPALVNTVSPGKYQIVYTLKNNSSANASFRLKVDGKDASDVQVIVPGQTKRYQYNVSYPPDTQIVLSLAVGSLTVVGFEVTDSETSQVLIGDPEINAQLVSTEVNNFYSLIYPATATAPMKDSTAEIIGSQPLTTRSTTSTDTSLTATSDVTTQALATETIRVLDLRYFPQNADTRRVTVNALSAGFKNSLVSGSKPKGYKVPTAVPSVNVTIVKTIERLKSSPNTTGPYAAWYHSLNTMLTENNNELCNEIINNKIDQVWGWFDVGTDTGGYNLEYQWTYSTGLLPNQYGNGAPHLCGGQRTFLFLGLDQNREADLAQHSFGHSVEAHLGGAMIPALFWTPFTGSTAADRPAPVCGNVHYPPNGTGGEGGIGYDYGNQTNVSTACENWKPDGNGTRTTINCTRWGCNQVGFAVWWEQNWPNKLNGLTFQGKAVPNWWEFFYNIDANVSRLISLNQYVDPSIVSRYFQAPSLNAPANGAQVTEMQPKFDWSDSSGASGYTIQVSTVNTFATFVVNQTIATQTSEYTPIVDLPRATTLYWRVKGNSGTTSTAWSATRSFTSASPSNKATITSPLTNTLVPTADNYKPLLKWQTAYSATIPAPNSFDIQLATDTAFTNLKVNLTNQAAENDIGGTTILQKKMLRLPNALDPSTSYYWRVRTRGANGHASGWSTVFILKTPIATVTSLSQPAAGSIINTSRPTFQWTGVAGATSYTIMYTTVQPVLATTVFTALGTIPGNTTTFTPTADLLRNKEYTWKVKATSTLYGSSLSGASTFTSANAANIPVLTKPLTNTITTGADPLKPLLEWKTTLAATIPSPVSYDIQVAKKADTTFINPVINKTSIPGGVVTGSTTLLAIRNWQVDAALQNATEYYWRVRSKTNTGHTSTWSALFLLKTPIQAVQSLNSPASGSTVKVINPVFDWSDVPSATSYTVEAQIAPSTTWAPLGTSTSSQWTPAATGLQRNKAYTWRVKATNILFGTSISNSSSFTSAHPPATPVLALPALGAVVTTNTPTLTWTQPATLGYATATRWHVQIATDATFNNIAAQEQNAVTTSYISPQLSPGTTYYWRVKAFSSQTHETPWTVARTFKTPPGVVSLSSSATQRTNAQSFTLSHGYTGAGRYLLVAASYRTTSTSGKVASLNYGGVNLVALRRDQYHEYATELWTLPANANPSGTVLTVNFTGPTDSHVVTAMTFINVMAGTPLRVATGQGIGANPLESTWGVSATHTLNLTTATTDLAVAVHSSYAGDFNSVSMTGATLVKNESFENVVSTIYTKVPTTTTVPFAFSVTKNFPWAASGVSLRSR